jgi:iron complex transport system substrate-binding protein
MLVYFKNTTNQMIFFKKITILLSICFLTYACSTKTSNKQQNTIESTIKHAKGFDIVKTSDYTKLIIKLPYPEAKEHIEYVLYTNKSYKNEGLKIPLNSIVVTSTTHIPFLELLNVEDKIVGFPTTDFISSPKTRALINANKIAELGNPESINTETLINLHPDVVIGFSLTSNNKMFNTIHQIGIPVILNGDWLEETPLGRAEWIKFYGILFDKEKQADSIFKTIENNYLAAKEIAKSAKTVPTLLSGGLFKDVWYMPAGESFEANYLNDANVNYLWKTSKGKGSLALNIENVFEKAKDADVWVSPSYHASLEELKNTNAIYSQFKAFQQKNIYSYMNNKGETGGIIYFELSPTRPDLVLKDLIKIAHPELLADYQLTFYQKLN